MLRCPLCQEDHPIPTKGASGFRQDFRIKTLIDKITTTKKSKAEAGICRKHPELPLDFYCTDARCKIIICRTCWKSDHQDHFVTPVPDDHDIPKNEIDTCSNILADNIKEIITAKERLSKSTDEVNLRIRREFKNSHAVLDTFENKFLTATVQRFVKEMDKLDSELDRLLLLQEELNPMAEVFDLDVEQVFRIRGIKENAVSWKLEYLQPYINKEAVVKLDFRSVKYESKTLGEGEESVLVNEDAVVLPKSRNISNLSQKRQTTSKDVVLQSNLNPSSNNIEIAVVQDSPASDNILSLLNLHIGEPTIRITNHSNDMLSKVACLDHNKDRVHHMTFSSTHGLILVQNNCLRGFKDVPFNMESFCIPWQPDGSVDIIQCGGHEYLVQRDVVNRKLCFYPSQDGCFVQPLKTTEIKCKTVKSYSCVDGYIIYSHARSINKPTFVTCCSGTQTLPPDKLWVNEVWVENGLKSTICAGIDDHGKPFALCAKPFRKGPNHPKLQVVLRAIYVIPGKRYRPWEVTYEQFDTSAESFDILDMAFDGHQFFVLYTKDRPPGQHHANLFVVSKDGLRHEKVYVNSQRFSVLGGHKMAVDRQDGRLFIATKDHMVHVFNIIRQL